MDLISAKVAPHPCNRDAIRVHGAGHSGPLSPHLFLFAGKKINGAPRETEIARGYRPTMISRHLSSGMKGFIVVMGRYFGLTERGGGEEMA